MGTYTLTTGDDLLGVDPFRYPSNDPGPYTVYGLAGNDNIVGGTFGDTLYGGDGNDSLAGAMGANLVYGGNGNDYIQFYNEGGTGGNGDLLGDLAYGDAGDDFFDFILGGAAVAHRGNGGAGIDALSVSFEPRYDVNNQLILRGAVINLTNLWNGGVGTVDTGSVTGIERLIDINGSEGNDRIVAGANYLAPINPATGMPFEAPSLYGWGGDDYISGTASGDTINGGSGSDTLFGEGGDDQISGAWGLLPDGNDVIHGGDGNDIIDGGYQGNDTLYGDAGDDRLFELQGNDRLYGGSGNDFLAAGEGNDVLDGGTGDDAMSGGTGDDAYYVDSAGDTVTESGDSGTDTVFASVSFTLWNHVERLTFTGGAGMTGTGNTLDNRMTGNGTANTLLGLDGADILIGNAGRDVLDGGNGDDTLTGGVARDELTGGAGRDTFRFTDLAEMLVTTATADVIHDFSQTDMDRIQLNLIDANSSTAGTNEAFSWIGSAAFSSTAGELRQETLGGNTYVSGDVNGDALADFYIRIDGVVTLVAGDFVL